MVDMGRIGPYELRGELGRGAMARVWRAWDPNLEREVAIKEPLFDYSLSKDVLEEMGRRFVTEGRTAARLNHPGIVTIHAANVWDGRPAIVMELVEGTTLADVLDRDPLSPHEALHVLDQLLDAVGYAHACGVIHRDIKPDNVFISSDGRVKLADFGIAHVDSWATRSTMAGVVLGTPGYMSPEQAIGAKVDARSDLFSIGVVAYEMLVGTNPFGSGDATTLLYRIVHEPAPELPESATEGLPADLRPAIMAALAKDPADRPQSAEDMRRMLHGEEPLQATEKRDYSPGIAYESSVRESSTKATGTARTAVVANSDHRTASSKRSWIPYAVVGGVALIVLIVVFVSATSGGSQAVTSNVPVQASESESSAEQSDSSTEQTYAVTFLGAGGEGSMKAIDVERGADFILPKCTFTREGYEFDVWTDQKGNEYEPGDTIAVESDVVLAARWVAIPTSSQATPANPGNSGNASNPTNTSNGSSQQASGYLSFPRMWSGTYIGTSSYEEDGHISRAVAFNFTTVEESGYVEGICYVGTDDVSPGETYGTCYIAGNIDWNSGIVRFRGTSWIDHGGLGDLREYSGTLDASMSAMSGSAWDVDTGLYETPWTVHAVSEINILQNGSMTTVR